MSTHVCLSQTLTSHRELESISARDSSRHLALARTHTHITCFTCALVVVVIVVVVVGSARVCVGRCSGSRGTGAAAERAAAAINPLSRSTDCYNLMGQETRLNFVQPTFETGGLVVFDSNCLDTVCDNTTGA
jgi:hypothetical protein